MMDGTASKDTFTIYEYETGKFLAYQTMSDWSGVFDMVEKVTEGGKVSWKIKPQSIGGDNNGGSTGTGGSGTTTGFDPHNWKPGSKDKKADLDSDGKDDTKITAISIQESGSFLFEIKGLWDIYSI